MSKKPKRQIRKQSFKAKGTISADTSIRDDFNPDYTFVIKDLRRIGMLAGTFILVLVILSFFLR